MPKPKTVWTDAMVQVLKEHHGQSGFTAVRTAVKILQKCGVSVTETQVNNKVRSLGMSRPQEQPSELPVDIIDALRPTQRERPRCQWPPEEGEQACGNPVMNRRTPYCDQHTETSDRGNEVKGEGFVKQRIGRLGLRTLADLGDN